MRRSAAPSQMGNNAKRPRFISPILKDRNTSNLIPKPSCLEKQESNCHDINIEPISKTASISEKNQTLDSKKNSKISPKFEVPIVTNANVSVKPGLSVHQSNAFCPPGLAPEARKSTIGISDDVPKSFYYNVMWCKLSKKKHKKWEGDAILVTKGRSATIMDLTAKEIGKGTGYKATELETLKEGHTLVIGGKEIEVMSTMSEDDFLSGTCFKSGTSSLQKPSNFQATMSYKSFSNPIKGFNTPSLGAGSNTSTPAPEAIKPRFDPNAPGALILPPPRDLNCKVPIVDVVVDPHLTHHLRPHQRQGIIFMYECVMGFREYGCSGVILADEMGLGKTLQCITLIWTLLKQGPFNMKPVIKKALVITPGSLVKNWAREFKKWLGNERLRTFAVGIGNKVQDFINAPLYPVMIISYEMLVKNIATIQNMSFDLIVCDEGHRLKNAQIKTASCVMGLNCKKRVVLTGTPVQNDLRELFSLIDICNPGILGTSSAFQNVYEGPILSSRQPSASPAEKSLGETRATELNRITSMFILRRTQEINKKYLPAKGELVIFCQASEVQLSIYRKLLTSRAVRSCFSSGPDTAQHLMCIAALRKLCNHPALLFKNAKEIYEGKGKNLASKEMEVSLYSDLMECYPPNFDINEAHVEHSGKLFVLAQLMKQMYNSQPRQRVVLVSNYTQTLDVLELFCKEEKYSCLRLDGQTPTNKRQQLVERFNSSYSEDFVFLLSSKAGGVGLNLVGASRLVLYDIDWNPANDLQAMARVWRDGQKHTVYIYRLLTTGSLEEKMYQRQVSKQGLSGVVIDSKMDTKLHFSPAELKDLFTLDELTKSNTHDLLVCDCGSNMTTESKKSEFKSTQTKNVSMDELMRWKHIIGPSIELDTKDKVVPSLLEGATYVFYNQTQVKEITTESKDCQQEKPNFGN